MMPVISSLDELAELVSSHDSLFLRWSADPDADRQRTHSCDGLTGASLPGLSANPLDVEPWWGRRPTVLWVARRLHDYSHLRESRGPGTRPWVLEGEEVGRGPDNEPLVSCRSPIAFIDDKVLQAAEDLLAAHSNTDWGPLDREND
jgi:hypothetical protein